MEPWNIRSMSWSLITPIAIPSSPFLSRLCNQSECVEIIKEIIERNRKERFRTVNGDPKYAQSVNNEDQPEVIESINTINKFLQEHAQTDLETQTRQAKLHFQKAPKKSADDNEDMIEPEEVTALNSTMNTQITVPETKGDTNPILCTDRFGNHYNFRVFIYCYTVGKEEVVLDLARYYKTKIVLDRDRYRMITSLNYFPEYFTNDPNEGFIHLTKGLNSAHKLVRNDVIHISLTGWVNCKSYLCLKKGEYQVAYSSHSNYEELDRFTSLIKPGIINPIVIERNEGMDLNEEGVKSMAGYYFWLRNFKKRGLELLRKLTRR